MRGLPGALKRTLTDTLQRNDGLLRLPTLSATYGLLEPPPKPRQAPAQLRPPAVATAQTMRRDTAPRRDTIEREPSHRGDGGTEHRRQSSGGEVVTALDSLLLMQ